jgi:DNA-binding response OmpR family regulator
MRPLRILVVEDDAMISTLLAEMLASMGHSVCAITTTETDTVSAAVYHRPDIMIVDALLREGSGVSAVKTISREQAIPHLFISGAALQLRDPNAVVLRKPFRGPELVDAIDRALSLAEANLAALKHERLTTIQRILGLPRISPPHRVCVVSEPAPACAARASQVSRATKRCRSALRCDESALWFVFGADFGKGVRP